MNQRRRILHTLSGFAIFTASGAWRAVWSASLQKLDPRDPQAVSLGYTDDTRTVDAKKYPKHTNAQLCSACQFYQVAQEAGKIAPCAIFGGKAVAAQGWCSAFIVKPP